MKQRIEISHTIPVLSLSSTDSASEINTIFDDTQYEKCVYMTPERIAEEVTLFDYKDEFKVYGKCYDYAYPETVVELVQYLKGSGFKTVRLVAPEEVPYEIRLILMRGFDEILIQPESFCLTGASE